MLELIWPWVLLLIPLPLLARLLRSASLTDNAVWWPNATLMKDNTEANTRKKLWRALSFLCALLAWCSLLLALARPVWLGEPTAVTPSGRDLLVAIDLSGSMQATDMQLNQQPVDRLQAAKNVLNQFIEARRGDRIGIIVFGSKAYLQAPLSHDLDTIQSLVNEAQIGFAGEQTAIGDAIGLGIKRLSSMDAEKRVMILMTDGANTAGRVNPEQAADFAASQQVRIHTIGIGADEMVVQGFFGPKVVNPSADLDEVLLQSIADKTGGRYFRAKNTQELRSIYHILDQLEPTPGEDLWQRPVTTLFHWLGLLSLVFLGIAYLIRKRVK